MVIRGEGAMNQAGMGESGGITDLPGIRVGHWTSGRRPTGCTVVLCEEGAVGGVDVRGAAPGTRETDLLNPLNLVERVHGVVLAGGSAFGLEAATGVVRYLEERGRGFETAGGRVPIVPAAVLYDLELGDGRIRPDAAAGYEACRVASRATPAMGNVGAGAGATVGKLFGGARAMKGGIGTALLRLPDGLMVGAIVAVNAVGDVIDPETGRIVAGTRSADGRRVLGAMAAIRNGERMPVLLGGTATTIGVVATNARLDKVRATRLAQMSHDGLARSINPIHTQYDGDAIFALATGSLERDSNVTLIGALAAEVVARAVVAAVRAAKGVAGFPAAGEL
jgi:L-aminopeptidase/D-esterase-like protein